MYGEKNIKSGVSKELARPLYIAIHYFAFIYTDFTLLVRSLFSVNGGAVMRFPGLRPATVISYATGLNLNVTENSSFPQKAIYSVTILLLFYFYSPIRYSVNMLRDATRFLNETTAFTRRETDASLQGTGILERLL